MTAGPRGAPGDTGSSAPAAPALSVPRLPLPRLHVVTDDDVLGREGFEEDAALLLRALGPLGALHLRGPGTDARRLHGVVGRLAAVRDGLQEERRPHLAVNDRVDVALAAGADGVHLGVRSLPPGVVRGLLGGATLRPWIGVSVHDPGEVRAGSAGADLLVAGTIFATPSHPGRAGGGTGHLASIVEAAERRPVVAIGGVTPGRVAACRAAGAWGVAVLRGVWEAPDPAEAVARYLRALDGAPEGA